MSCQNKISGCNPPLPPPCECHHTPQDNQTPIEPQLPITQSNLPSDLEQSNPQQPIISSNPSCHKPCHPPCHPPSCPSHPCECCQPRPSHCICRLHQCICIPQCSTPRYYAYMSLNLRRYENQIAYSNVCYPYPFIRPYI